MSAGIDGVKPLREWVHHGYLCRILVSPLGASLNGYVQLFKEHPDFDKGYDDIEADAPGGLTYGVDGKGWVGFDTAHSGDIWTEEALTDAGVELTPKAVKFMESWNRDVAQPWAHRWTLDELVLEVDRLAERFEALNNLAVFGADF